MMTKKDFKVGLHKDHFHFLRGTPKNWKGVSEMQFIKVRGFFFNIKKKKTVNLHIIKI